MVCVGDTSDPTAVSACKEADPGNADEWSWFPAPVVAAGDHSVRVDLTHLNVTFAPGQANSLLALRYGWQVQIERAIHAPALYDPELIAVTIKPTTTNVTYLRGWKAQRAPIRQSSKTAWAC